MEKEEKEGIQKEFQKEEPGIQPLNDGVQTESNESQQIEAAFTEEISYEAIADVESSPMNEAVKEGEVSEGTIAPPNSPLEVDGVYNEEEIPPELLKQFVEEHTTPTDAPEQEINIGEEAFDEIDSGEQEEEGMAIKAQLGISQADHHAGIAADSLIGMTDNLLETGGGFLVKMEKKKIYYDFDKITTTADSDTKSLSAQIDQFNDKAIQKIKLDDEDKKQLRPVLKEVLKRRSTALTPEQQLIALGITILAKHGKAAIEIRKERMALQGHFDEMVKKCLAAKQVDKVEENKGAANGKSEEVNQAA